MQDDAGTGGSDRVTDGDGATIGVELVRINVAERLWQAKLRAAVIVVTPGGEASQHLRGEGFVDFPGVEIVQSQTVALQDRRRCVHGAKAHLGWIEGRPLAIDEPSQWLQTPAVYRVFGGEHEQGGTVGDLRTVAGGDVAIGLVENRPQRAELFRRRVAAHAVVFGIDGAVAVHQRCDLGETAGGACGQGATVTLRRVLIHRAARDAELAGKVLRRLAHRQANHGVGESLQQPDDRRQQARSEALEYGQLLAQGLGCVPSGKPAHHGIGEQQGRAREGVGAAGQNQLRATALDVGGGRIERLHAGSAIPHHRPAGHLVAAAQAQRQDAADVDLVRRGCSAAEDHLVEVGGQKWLAQQ